MFKSVLFKKTVDFRQREKFQRLNNLFLNDDINKNNVDVVILTM